ncbi:aspartyl/asparaginyl beta-hydroxylase domain-containing protein [Ferruginibacter paludis]|uniref:aspartyl/asparaginyl beta-hydroxylase domain-containing protein n=1 Tax=Ferruginibacter paludis TaxID=1310417 RepID=UPI0025B4CB0D|nr:aspartyl/asparaginyl beta-hydroxylase domain-containing protein [Ferruginibacter paludis]MDN3658243.1 aspartyl/asparaginyl beta-hydroxylase domain-containing protein [Ferruginibacter paludis]
MIKYSRIKQRFDVQQMQEEVNRLEANFWKPHYNEKHYEGSWTILPLRSLNGSIENNIAIHSCSLQTNMQYEDTTLLNDCPYLASVLNYFKCEKMSVRLMNLNAGASIKEHSDYEMSLEEGEARFHIPVLTNSDVAFFIEEEQIPMDEGECWYLNLSLRHRVNNSGATNRIHLVIDCKVNNWVKGLINNQAELTEECTEMPAKKSYNAADKAKIIHQLRMIATPVSLDLANKMENDSN